MESIAIYGAGGFGKEVACLINAVNGVRNEWNFVGFFDDNQSLKDSSNYYGRILGGMEVLNSWETPLSVVMAIANPKILELLVGRISNSKIVFPNLLAPDVLFLDKGNIELGQGNVIGFRCFISCNVSLGNFNLMNIDVFMGHDSTIGSFNVFNPSVRISGEVTIGNSNSFGLSSSVLQQKCIENENVIAPHSAVYKDISVSGLYAGNPARQIR
jgi:sugar O-acyltransferase (sialic acid O-acetyltransferase NeuD family)